MSLTVGRSIPATRKLLTPAYVVLSIGLGLALGAVVIVPATVVCTPA
jgi:predicted acyltransferase